jgi:hypothetical protein
MRVLLITLLLTSCYLPNKIQDNYQVDKQRYYNGKKILYSDTIRYDCGKTQVVHYYEE